ncbi:transposase [Actinosynnema sp. NPDC059335]|uniref:helix-turn-helix domain-containing protein n=1 Tax=Actinosynnema sp. NPDC059335 TaxID=3346804 RepID=UPI00366A6ED6
MSAQDARRLPPDALEALRRRAIAAVESGVSRAEVARVFGVSRQTISTWHREYRSRGEEALQSRRRGRRRGEQLALSYAQQLWTIRVVTTCGPEQVGLGYWLWTNQAVVELVNSRFGIALSVPTARNYLIRWGVLAESVLLQRPRVRPTAPPGAEALWVHTAPAQGLTGPPSGGAGGHVLYAVSARGTVLFLAGRDPFDGVRLTEFFTRLVRQRGRRLTIVQTWRPTRRADALTAWLGQQEGRVSVRFPAEGGAAT